MKIKKLNPATEAAPKAAQKKVRAKPKGEISHYILTTLSNGDEGMDNQSFEIASKNVEYIDETEIKINGVSIKSKGGKSSPDYGIFFDSITPVYKVKKPNAGDKMMYQGTEVEYVQPYKSGKRLHLVKLPNGMVFKATLNELTASTTE